MLEKVITYERPQNEVFRSFLKSIFANSTIKLSEQELDIMDEVKRIVRFDADKIAKKLNISINNLNNYKSKLVKKQLLIKSTMDPHYYVNPKLLIDTKETELIITLKFKFNAENQV